MQNHYDALGVSKTATDAEIRSAYRKLAKKYHPDVNHTAKATDRFTAISVAYETLSDPRMRADHDRDLNATTATPDSSQRVTGPYGASERSSARTSPTYGTTSASTGNRDRVSTESQQPSFDPNTLIPRVRFGETLVALPYAAIVAVVAYLTGFIAAISDLPDHHAAGITEPSVAHSLSFGFAAFVALIAAGRRYRTRRARIAVTVTASIIVATALWPLVTAALTALLLVLFSRFCALSRFRIYRIFDRI